MSGSEFTEYAIRESRDALASRQALPPEVQKIADAVMWELADDPRRYGDRTLPAEQGASRYVHPSHELEITYKVDEQGKVVYFLHVSARALPARRTVFISYSHEDSKWVPFVKKFLTLLEREGVIKFWDDRQIKAGERWEDAIQQAIASSRAAVLLVSQDFLVSEFITRYELPRLLANAKQLGTNIFWIPLSPSTVFETHQDITAFQSPFENPRVSLEELKPPARKKALVTLYRKVREALALQSAG